MACAQVAAKPARDQRDVLDVWQCLRHLIERHGPIGPALPGVYILRDRTAGTYVSRHGFRRIGELAASRNEHDAADIPPDGIEIAIDLECELRQAIAKSRERKALEHDIGNAPVGRRLANADPRCDQLVRGLRLGAVVETIRHVREIEFLPVPPNAPDIGDDPSSDRHREARKIAVADRRCSATCAATLAAPTGGRGYPLLLDFVRPDHLPTEPRPSIDAGQRRPFRRRCDMQIAQPRPVIGARAARSRQQLLIDIRSRERADL